MEQLTDFPELSTERLRLRRITSGDIHAVHQGLSDPRVTVYYALAFPTLEATQEQMDWYEQIWQERSGLWWAICQKGEEEMIGAVGFNNYDRVHRKAEIGYWLPPQYRGRGYASEALTEVLKTAFTSLRLHRIEAYVEGGNDASVRMLERFGFTHEGCLRECEVKNDRYIDVHIFARLETDSGARSSIRNS